MNSAPNPLRNLPPVNTLLDDLPQLVAQYGRPLTVAAIRDVLDAVRDAVRDGAPVPDTAALHARIEAALHTRTQPTLRPVINATGVLIHTNLGRAPLSEEALAAMREVGTGYSTLEFNLERGERGSRNVHPERLLCDLTGAEAALVVNNCASALVLVLAAQAQGREVIISRGQSVEIGGGFRIPEIMVQSGAHLVEVGTTNKTRPADYAKAITPNTAMLLRVHSSNFKQIGFTQTVSIEDMAAIAHEGGVLLVDDVGSGALIDPTTFGLSPEPLVQDSIAAGADLVLFSGDKLLGGPQAGIIVGKQEAVDSLKRHPLARALRADKLILSGLLATLAAYQRSTALDDIPLWWMMNRKLCDLGRIAKTWSKQVPGSAVQKGESTVGGGSTPGDTLPTVLLALDVPRPNDIARRLREQPTPIIARVQDDRVLLDPRTVFPQQEAALLDGVRAVLASPDAPSNH